MSWKPHKQKEKNENGIGNRNRGIKARERE